MFMALEDDLIGKIENLENLKACPSLAPKKAKNTGKKLALSCNQKYKSNIELIEINQIRKEELMYFFKVRIAFLANIFGSQLPSVFIRFFSAINPSQSFCFIHLDFTKMLIFLP